MDEMIQVDITLTPSKYTELFEFNQTLTWESAWLFGSRLFDSLSTKNQPYGKYSPCHPKFYPEHNSIYFDIEIHSYLDISELSDYLTSIPEISDFTIYS